MTPRLIRVLGADNFTLSTHSLAGSTAADDLEGTNSSSELGNVSIRRGRTSATDEPGAATMTVTVKDYALGGESGVNAVPGLGVQLYLSDAALIALYGESNSEPAQAARKRFVGRVTDLGPYTMGPQVKPSMPVTAASLWAHMINAVYTGAENAIYGSGSFGPEYKTYWLGHTVNGLLQTALAADHALALGDWYAPASSDPNDYPAASFNWTGRVAGYTMDEFEAALTSTPAINLDTAKPNTTDGVPFSPTDRLVPEIPTQNTNMANLLIRLANSYSGHIVEQRDGRIGLHTPRQYLYANRAALVRLNQLAPFDISLSASNVIATEQTKKYPDGFNGASTLSVREPVGDGLTGTNNVRDTLIGDPGSTADGVALQWAVFHARRWQMQPWTFDLLALWERNDTGDRQLVRDLVAADIGSLLVMHDRIPHSDNDNSYTPLVQSGGPPGSAFVIGVTETITPDDWVISFDVAFFGELAHMTDAQTQPAGPHRQDDSPASYPWSAMEGTWTDLAPSSPWNG